MKKLILLIIFIPSLAMANPHKLYEDVAEEVGIDQLNNSDYSNLYKTKMECKKDNRFNLKSFTVQRCFSSRGLVCSIFIRKATGERTMYCSI